MQHKKTDFTAIAFAASACILTLAPLPSHADARSSGLQQRTLTVMAAEQHWLDRVTALAATLRHENGLRILPMAGDGSVQALNDLLYLDVIDAALLPADTAHYAEAQGLTPKIREKVSVVAQLAELPLVLVARKEFGTITSLAGRKISTGPSESASFASGEMIFGSLGIPFTRVAKSDVDAIKALERGEADAALLLGTESLSALKKHDSFHVLALPLPAGLEAIYVPYELRLGAKTADAPFVNTVATSLLLLAADKGRNNEKHKRLQRFATVYFANMPPSGDVPNWRRHSAAIASARGGN